MTDWRKEDEEKNRVKEEEVRDEVNELPMFDVVLESEENSLIDDRDYVDKMFKSWRQGEGVRNKTVQGVKCVGTKVPDVSDNALCIFFYYKFKRTQGKRDPVAGHHVLRIPTEKGPHWIPLHLARKYALQILRLMDGVEDTLVEMKLELKPEDEEE